MKGAERISAESVDVTELICDKRTELEGVSEQGVQGTLVKGNVCAGSERWHIETHVC